MYKMIIVDDEENIRDVLKNIIDWDNLGIEICAEAANGQEALELIDLHQPDIVITDVHMPVMNGIDLIKNRKDNTKFIVLSGYIDFDYVKNSMKFGALNYILKPISAEELSQVMIEALEILDISREKQLEKQTAEAILLENTLNRLIQGNISLKELREKSELLNINLRHPNLLVGLIRLTQKDIMESDGACIHEVKEIVSQTVLSGYTGRAFYDNTGNIVFIAAVDETNTGKDILNGKIYSVIMQIENKNLKAVGAVGLVVHSTQDLCKSYKSALALLEYQVLLPNQKVFSTDFTVVKESTDTFIPPNPLHLSEMFKQHDVSAIQNYIDDLLLNENRNIKNPLSLKYYAIEIASAIFSGAAAVDISQKDLAIIRQDYLFYIKNCVEINNYIDVLNRLVEQILNNVLSNNKQYSPKIAKMITEINQNFKNQSISLKTFAYSLDVNPAYLGRQFKIETGNFFSDYLNSIRIEEAKKLLESTDLSAAEISEAVGFTTSNYFYGLFKKITGVSTSLYRSLKK